MWFEGGLEDETDFLDSARRDVEVVGAETEGEFAGGGLPLFAVGGGDEFRSGCEGGCVVFGGRERGDDLAIFDRATELVEIEVLSVDGGKFCCNLCNVRCAKHSCEFSEGEFWLATKLSDKHVFSIARSIRSSCYTR